MKMNLRVSHLRIFLGMVVTFGGLVVSPPVFAAQTCYCRALSMLDVPGSPRVMVREQSHNISGNFNNCDAKGQCRQRCENFMKETLDSTGLNLSFDLQIEACTKLGVTSSRTVELQTYDTLCSNDRNRKSYKIDCKAAQDLAKLGDPKKSGTTSVTGSGATAAAARVTVGTGSTNPTTVTTGTYSGAVRLDSGVGNVTAPSSTGSCGANSVRIRMKDGTFQCQTASQFGGG